MVKTTDKKVDKKAEFEKSLKVLKEIHDPRFGQCTILSTKNGEKVLLKKITSNTKKEAAKNVKVAEERIKLNGNNLQQMLNYTSSEKSDFCSTYYVTKGYYQMPESDLENLINSHKKANKNFDHEVLINLAYQMFEAACHLHKHHASFDDIRPMFIGTGQKENNFLLLDRLADPSPAATCQFMRYTHGDSIYMSPSLFRAMANKQKLDKNVDHDAQKSDTWSIGLCILEAGLLCSIQDIYDKKQKNINEVALNEHLNSFREKYGHDDPLLCEIVENCLKVDENERVGCCELLSSALPPYDQIIAHFVGKTSNDHVREVVVESRAPVEHHRVENVVETHVPVEVCGSDVVRREVQTIRSTAPVEVRREVIRREPIVRHQRLDACEEVPCNVERVEVCEQPKVIRVTEEPKSTCVRSSHHVRAEPVVIRRSHHGEPHTSNIIRSSHANHEGAVVRRLEAPVQSSTVIRRSHHEETVSSNVIRRSHHGEPVVRKVSHHDGENVVRRVEGGHTGNVVRRVSAVGAHHQGEGVVRRVEGCHTGNVVREGGHTGNVVRRVSAVGAHHQGEGVVRRVEGGHTGNVVRRVSAVGAHHHGEGVVRRVEGNTISHGHHDGPVRRVVRKDNDECIESNVVDNNEFVKEINANEIEGTENVVISHD